LTSLPGSEDPQEGKGNMTFDEMIKEKQTPAPDKVRDNQDKTKGLPEGNDCSLEVLQWYLRMILECV
jgi:hypothetical protein